MFASLIRILLTITVLYGLFGSNNAFSMQTSNARIIQQVVYLSTDTSNRIDCYHD
jgi:hypothetical protein